MYSLEINREFFQQSSKKTIELNKPNINKYNIRVDKNDLIVLDLLAKQYGTSRAQLLNQFVEKILLNSLLSLDTRSAYLVAETADNLAGSTLASRWLFDLGNHKYNVVYQLKEHCLWEDSCTEEPTNKKQIYEKLSNAIKNGKLEKFND
ncbi:hypothetical protein I2F17_11890 [Acinetobacter sp. B10A]|uniref:hypothetical protein n=1 Tax=Acinetobacter baretiae TaxID=2605383 RepID=UPI001B3C689C|nr:hypothetical protein [Acinetobacter baretiae]MBF7686518.1 hypothetical protein [Acinetobacter baretiae]